MKLSEMFEGKNSSLYQAFSGASKPQCNCKRCQELIKKLIKGNNK